MKSLTPQSFNNLQNLLSRNGSLVSSPIHDPQLKVSRVHHKFTITSVKVNKKLIQPELAEYDASPDDFLYDVEFKVKYESDSSYMTKLPSETRSYGSKGMKFQKLCAIRHDFVASLLEGETDRSIRELGIMLNLTPDFIDESTSTVLELATTGTNFLKVMEASYIGKRIAYEEILKSHGKHYLILVVGPDSSLSNMPVTDDTLDDLTLRCRVGLSLTPILERELGFELESSDDAALTRTEVVKELEKFNATFQYPENFHFNKELFDLQRPLNEEEESHVTRILGETLDKAISGQNNQGDEGALQNYLLSLESYSTKKQKLVTIFPLIWQELSRVGKRDSFMQLGSNLTVPKGQLQILKGMETKDYIMNERNKSWMWEIESYRMAKDIETRLDKYKYNKSGKIRTGIHELRKQNIWMPLLDEEQEEELALQGVMAKRHSEDEDVLMKEEESKKTFHPCTYTDDIEKFWLDKDNVIPEHLRQGIFQDDNIYEILRLSKEQTEYKLTKESDSMIMYEHLALLNITQLGETISSICSEISMEYKNPTRPNEWVIKPLRDRKIILFLYPTGTHCFFFTAHEKNTSHCLETGHVGQYIYETENYYVSGISSITESYIDHFLKAGPYIGMIAAHLLQHFGVPVFTQPWEFPTEYHQTLRYVVMTYLNNKLDHEEMLTNLRFLYMKLFQEVGSNTNDYIDRLPSVLRSRLSVFTLNRIIKLKNYYDNSRIIRRATKKMSGIDWEYRNLKVIFHNGFVSIEQLIDSFYFSYVVTKNKSSMGDQSYKMFDKIVKESMWAFENLQSKSIKVWGLLDTPVKHRWDYAYERHSLEVCLNALQERHGPEVLTMMNKRIITELSRVTFSKISTLKASSKDYSNGQTVPDYRKGMTRSEFMTEFKRLNPSLGGKRPRVITTLSQLISSYSDMTGDRTPTPIKVTLWSANLLIKRGWFFSDSFIKDQHNGVREIHVIEISARLIQFHSELIAKTICQFFENDSVSSPDSKRRFMHEHTLESEKILGPNVSVNKSADASKWCQRNHVSQFFFDLIFFTDKVYHPFLYAAYYLWTVKRIAVPPELIQNLDSHRDLINSSPGYIKMREAFLKGSHPFLEPRSSMVEIPYGMFQGICHEASCLKHNIKQTSWKRLAYQTLQEKFKLPSHITIIQGSDDSGALISIPKTQKFYIMIAIIMLWWKEYLAEYSSIWTSIPKTSVGTVNLIEYNSDWYFFMRNIRPTFRWNSACLETSLVERIPERVEQFYNSLSQSLESGASTFLCSIIQLYQASLHYRLLGINTHYLSKRASVALIQSRNISLGYFPLEPDHIAGITGFDFQLFLLNKQGIGVNNWELESRSEWASVDYDSKIDKIIRESLRSFSVRFGNVKNYETVIERTGLTGFEEVVNRIANNPELLYTNLYTWEQEETKMVLSLHNPSVRSSLSAYQPNVRMMSSSSYLLNRPCVSGMGPTGRTEKRSLMAWLDNAVYEVDQKINTGTPWFCNQHQYEEFERFFKSMKDSISYQEVDMRRSLKHDLLVWGEAVDVEIPLMDLVKRKWFNLRTVRCSHTVFNSLWATAKVKYPFLRDDYDKTRAALNMEDLCLFQFLQQIQNKTRKLHLLDSTSKSGSVWNTATRIFWPSTKVRSFYDSTESSVRELKHQLHCLLSYFFQRSYVEPIALNLIKTNKTLSTSLSEIPASMFKLKLISDVLNSKDRLNILMQIEQVKMGTIGYFFGRQEKTEHGYVGDGEWRGMISGIDCVIKMTGKEVAYIKLQRLTDINSLSHSLHSLIREFKLKMPEETLISRSRLYLDDKGQLFSSIPKPTSAVPIIIDSKLKLNLKDHLLNRRWFVMTEGETVRIVCEDIDHMGNTTLLTILSETYGQYYWDPMLPAPMIDDENFQQWCRGSPCKALTLCHQLMLPESELDIKNTQSLLRSGQYHRPDTKLDMGKFVKYFDSFLKRKLLGQNFTEMKYDYQDRAHQRVKRSQKAEFIKTFTENPRDDVIALMKSLNTYRDDLEEEIRDWLEISDDSGSEPESLRSIGDSLSEELMIDMSKTNIWSLQDSTMQEIKRMFEFYDDTKEGFLEYHDDEYKRNVRQIEMFLSSFCDILQDMPNSKEIFLKLKERSDLSTSRLEGPGGTLIYLTTGKGLLSKGKLPSKEEALEYDTRSISDYFAISSAKDGRHRNSKDLETEIMQLQQLMPSLKDPLLSTMSKRLSKLESELSWVKSLEGVMESDSGLSQYDKSFILSRMIFQAEAESVWSPPALSPNPDFKVELLLSYASDNLNQVRDMGVISDSEMATYQQSLWSPNLRSAALRAICFYWGCNIRLSNKGKEIFNYRRSLFKNELDIDFDIN